MAYNEIYMSAEDVERIDGSNIKQVFSKFEPILALRRKLYTYYEREDQTLDNIANPTTALVFSPVARYATNIAAGYFIGKPCKYYSRVTTTVRTVEMLNGQKRTVFEKKVADDMETKEDERSIKAYLDVYNAVLRQNHSDEEDIALARDTLIHRTAFERVYIIRDKNGNPSIRFKSIDPKKAVLIKDDTVERNPVAFLCREQMVDPVTNTLCDQYELITAQRHVFYKFFSDNLVNMPLATDSNISVIPGETKFIEYPASNEELNLLKLVGIPIIEYPMPEGKGFYEDVIPLMNARDALINNLRNTFKYNDDAILLMIGYMKPQTDEEAQQIKASIEDLKTMWLGEDNDVKWLLKDVPIDSVRGYFEILTNDIFGMLGIKNPVRQSEVYQNITTVRYQNYGMDNTVLGLERSFEKALLQGRAQMITAVLNFFHKTGWDWEKLDVTFDRNLPSSRSEEAQFIAQMKGADIMSDKDILDQVQFVDDSTAAVARKLEQDEREAKLLAQTTLRASRNSAAENTDDRLMTGETEDGVERGDGRLREERQTNR
jgi:SPP1 family phage portal protein